MSVAITALTAQNTLGVRGVHPVPVAFVIAQGTPEMHLFRTLEGHVLSGTTHGLHRRLHLGGSFITIQQPLQHTPSGIQLLPSALVMHRSFVAVDGQVGEGESLSDWTSRVAPFQATSAAARHVLTPG